TFMSFIGFSEALGITVSAAVFANWLMMALMNIAVIIVRIKRPELKRRFRYPINIKNIPVLAAFAVLACIWIISFIDTVPLLVGFSWVVLIIIWYFAYSRKRWKFIDEGDLEYSPEKINIATSK